MLASSSTPASGVASSVIGDAAGRGPGIAGPARVRAVAVLDVGGRRAGPAAAAPGGASCRRAPTSMMSMPARMRASSRVSTRCGHQRRQPLRRLGRPTTSVAQLCRWACAASAAAMSSPVSTAVSAPSSSASLSTARMRSRCAASQPLQPRRLDVGRMPAHVELGRQARGACAPSGSAPSCGPTQASMRAARCSRPAADRLRRTARRASRARRPRRARRCAAARSRAARSGCPCGRSSAPRARPAPAGRPCRPQAREQLVGRRCRPARPRRPRRTPCRARSRARGRR